jgi:hypothetical protein
MPITRHSVNRKALALFSLRPPIAPRLMHLEFATSAGLRQAHQKTVTVRHDGCTRRINRKSCITDQDWNENVSAHVTYQVPKVAVKDNKVGSVSFRQT